MLTIGWDILTSYWTLGIGSGLAGIGLIVALLVLGPAVVLPVLQRAAAAVLGCRPCLVAVAIAGAGYGGLLLGANREASQCDARVEQRLEEQRQAAAEAARARDVGIADELDKKYQPEIQRLARLAEDLKGKVQNANQPKPAAAGAKPAAACRLGDAARRLRS
jgi:hypothetical protein